MQILNYTTYGLPMIVCVFIAASLIIRSDRTREHVLLGLSFALLAIANFTMVCYYVGFWIDSPVMDIVCLTSTLTSSAVYFIYVMSVTSPTGVEKKHFLIFIPTVALVSANIFVDILLGWDGTKHFLAAYETGRFFYFREPGLEVVKAAFDSNCFRALNFGQTLGVVIYGRFRFQKYLKSLAGYYSNKGGAFVDSEWKLNLYVEIMTGAMLLMCIMPSFVIRHYPIVMAVMSVTFSFAICMIGIEGHLIKGNAREFKELTAPDAEMKNAVETENVITKKYISKVQISVEQFIAEKGYLDPNITLEDLAQRLNTNRYYLSQTLKLVYGESFSCFINSRRIEYAKSLIMKEGDQDAVLKSIAIESGYNNFVNFHRNFVKFTGKNPTDWRKASREGLS